VFDVPVTIAPSDKLLGTHVFTAEVDKNDPNVLRWSVVSLPSPRAMRKDDEDERATRRRKVAGSIPPNQTGAGAEHSGRSAGPHHDPAGRWQDRRCSTGASIMVSDRASTRARPAKAPTSSSGCARLGLPVDLQWNYGMLLLVPPWCPQRS
jgi:hypothetical protein